MNSLYNGYQDISQPVTEGGLPYQLSYRNRIMSGMPRWYRNRMENFSHNNLLWKEQNQPKIDYVQDFYAKMYNPLEMQSNQFSNNLFNAYRNRLGGVK